MLTFFLFRGRFGEFPCACNIFTVPSLTPPPSMAYHQSPSTPFSFQMSGCILVKLCYITSSLSRSTQVEVSQICGQPDLFWSYLCLPLGFTSTQAVFPSTSSFYPAYVTCATIECWLIASNYCFCLHFCESGSGRITVFQITLATHYLINTSSSPHRLIFIHPRLPPISLNALLLLHQSALMHRQSLITLAK